MDARLIQVALVAAAILSMGASARTKNFIASARTPQLAQEMCQAAEHYRSKLAIEWLGKELPDWPQPCPMTILDGPQLGAGGATTFEFHGRVPHFLSMSIQGSRERLLDSVIPHEVTHTIFATHFGRPLPRWADEGACTVVEHDVEKSKQKQLLYQFLTTGQGIAFNRMFSMMEYPRNMLPLYSQGYSVARYLIAQGGKQKFVEYVGEGMQTNNWPAVTRKHYQFRDLSDLQVTWLEWVRRRCPPLEQVPELTGAGRAAQIQLAAATQSDSAPAGQTLSHEVETDAAPTPAALAVHRSEESPAKSATGGWYAKQRDLALAREANPAATARLDARPASTATAYQPGSIARPTVIRQSLARQQPIGRPQQTEVEWGARPGELVPVGPPVPPSQPAAAGSYYSRRNQNGLLRR